MTNTQHADRALIEGALAALYPSASSECPVCGDDTPHRHEDNQPPRGFVADLWERLSKLAQVLDATPHDFNAVAGNAYGWGKVAPRYTKNLARDLRRAVSRVERSRTILARINSTPVPDALVVRLSAAQRELVADGMIVDDTLHPAQADLDRLVKLEIAHAVAMADGVSYHLTARGLALRQHLLSKDAQHD